MATGAGLYNRRGVHIVLHVLQPARIAIVRLQLTFVACVLGVFFAASAVAQTDPPAPDRRTTTWDVPRGETPPAPEIEEGRRDVPDLDGRKPARGPAAEATLWVPRVVLFPAYLVSEYVIRKPVGALVTWIEREAVIPKVAHVLSFGTGLRAGVVPTAFFDFGVRPSVGLYAWANGVPTDHDRLRLRFAWGGDSWWLFHIRQRVPLGSGPSSSRAREGSEVSLDFVYEQRPDHLVWLPFSDGATEQAASYFQREVGGGLATELLWGTLDGVALSARAAHWRFDDGTTAGVEAAEDTVRGVLGDDPEVIEQRLPGFEGYGAGVFAGNVFVDSRRQRPAPGSGARLELWGELGEAWEGPVGWFRWGGEAAGFADVDGRQRVLSLRQRVEFSEETDDRVPFTELAQLGGIETMRGFRDGRFRGRSTSVTTVQYDYPVWSFADGYLFYEVGGAFGDHLDGFALPALSQSFGLGMRSSNDRDAQIAVLVGAGTEPFEDGASVESVRLLFGLTRGY